MVYAVCVVFTYQKRKIIMIKKIVVAVIIIATAIAVANWTLVQLEEGYKSSYPSELDK